MRWRADQEAQWQNIRRNLQADPPDTAFRPLVLAAHPDDETIGVSLLLARFPQSMVVFLTDGAPRDTNLWSAGVKGSREEYAEVRRKEALMALARAAVDDGRIFSMGAVDQEAIQDLEQLIPRFCGLLARLRPQIVITHPYEGGHPDHDTAALIANLAIASLDESCRPALLEMTSYHARNGQCVTGEFLGGGDAHVLCFELPEFARARKREMMEAYSSQRAVLDSFAIDKELLRPAPEYDFSQPPHEGKLWYECMGWPMTGSNWRMFAAAAIAKFQERACA